MAPATLLPSVLGVDPAGVTVVLFSQPDCSFCEEADYLKPPDASRPRHVRVAEGLTTGARQLVNGPDDADSEADSEADLARRQHVSFAPTIAPSSAPATRKALRPSSACRATISAPTSNRGSPRPCRPRRGATRDPLPTHRIAVAHRLGGEGSGTVAYGPGIAMLEGDSPMAGRVAETLRKSVKVVACENTMKAQKLVYANILPDVGNVSAGVVELMQKQQQGYAYIRP